MNHIKDYLIHAFFLFALPALAAEVRIGVATTDITPSSGVAMAGYYHERGAEGVLDPLYSKAMVIEHDGERPLRCRLWRAAGGTGTGPPKPIARINLPP